MAEPVVKFPAEQKAQNKEPAPGGQRKGWRQTLRERRRTLLLVVVPLIAVVGGVAFYLSGDATRPLMTLISARRKY